jgi:hypothetical protein
MKKNNRFHWRKFIGGQFLIYLFLVLILIGGGYGVMSATVTLPENPMNTQKESLNADLNSLDCAADEDDQVYIPIAVQSVQSDHTQNQTKTDDGLSQEKTDQTNDAKEQDQDGNTANNTQSNPNSSGSGGTGGSTDPNENQDNITYFTTSIKDGETITATDYSFKIYHQISSLTVKAVHVFINDTELQQFNGNVILTEGSNTIRIVVDYNDVSGNLISPSSKNYTVNVDTKSLVFDSDLDNLMVNDDIYSFYAYAKYLGEDVALTVEQNGTDITENNGNYNVTLNEGENIFTLSATTHGQSKEVSYTVTYINDHIFKIRTSLEDTQTIYDDEIPFTVTLKNTIGKATISVYCGSRLLQPTDGEYTAPLSIGENVITINATNGDGATAKKTCTVTFTRILADPSNPDPEPQYAPTLESNLEGVTDVNNSIFTLNLLAEDYKGNRLYANHITVKLNGNEIGNSWEDDTSTTYRLELTAAQNEVTVLVVDANQHSKFFTYQFTYTAPGGGIIGYITVSIEATTAGLGYLIQPTQVPIYNMQPASYVIDELLTDTGFTYSCGNGTLDSNFYLARIYKNGISNNYAIPEDLKEILDATEEIKSPPDGNSLGQFDFYQGSGWMYSINGDYPNYGFNQYYPADGDVVRIRYTMAQGKDIGGGASTGGVSQNFDKEW